MTTTGIANSSGGSGSGSSGSPTLTFSVIGVDPAVVPITASGDLVLLANPSFILGNGGNVKLTLLNSNGTPVPNAQLTGSCGAPLGITSTIPVTDAQGMTTVSISGDMNGDGDPKTATCTFTTSTGSPTVTVTVQGIDNCLTLNSPPPDCPNVTPSTVVVTIQSTNGNPVTASVSITPSGGNCSVTNSTTQSCSHSLTQGSYTVTGIINLGTFVGWSGDCTPSGPQTTTHKAILVVPAAASSLSCTLQVSGP